MIKMIFCDIDGCMGDFIKPEYPLKQDLYGNKMQLMKIKERVNRLSSIGDGILLGVCTGRSFYQADHIMKYSGCQGPSIFEMGNVIFDPKEGVYNLFERHEKFKKNTLLINDFILWKNKMKETEEKLKERFPNSGIRQMKDRTCMLTYEFRKDISKELYSLLLELMPDELKKAISSSILKVLISRNALDILPNLTKGDAVNYLAGLYKVRKEEVLAIGDSSHSDLDMLKSAGLVACPDNADTELKRYVLEHNGFVVPNSSNSGFINILDLAENLIKFTSLRNGYN